MQCKVKEENLSCLGVCVGVCLFLVAQVLLIFNQSNHHELPGAIFPESLLSADRTKYCLLLFSGKHSSTNINSRLNKEEMMYSHMNASQKISTLYLVL